MEILDYFHSTPIVPGTVGMIGNDWERLGTIGNLMKQGTTQTMVKNPLFDTDKGWALIRQRRDAIKSWLAAANDTTANAAPDPDRWQPPALSDSEIATMTARLERFQAMGLDIDTTEALVDKMLLRDRDSSDTRRLCLECRNLVSGRCANARAAGFIRSNELGRDLALLLKRCQGFQDGGGTLAVTTPKKASVVGPRLGHPLIDTDKAMALKYWKHQAGCRSCQAAGSGHGQRCDQGSILWQQYQAGGTK